MSAREHAAQRLDAERQRRHIEQQHVLDVALEHAGLDRRADRDHLVRVHALVRLLAEDLLHRLDDLGHAGHAADQDHLVDLGRRQPGILDRRAARPDRAAHQLVDQRFELGARQLDVEVLRPVLVRRDEGQVDLGLRRRRQLDLGLLRGLLEALQRELVVAQVDALLLLELVGQVVDHPGVEILAAEERVAVGRLHLEHAVADLEDRDVERAAAEVVDRDGAGALLLEPVGERGRRRLVDDAQHLEPGDLAGVLGGLALGIVEVGGNRDHRLGHRLAEIALGGLLHLLQDEGRHLRRRIFLAPDLDPGVVVVALDDLVGDQPLVLLAHRVVEGAPDQALDGEHRVLRVGDRLSLRRLADQPLAIVGERHHRGRRAGALRVLDHLDVRSFHDRDARVRGAEIDTNRLRHVYLSLWQSVRARIGTRAPPWVECRVASRPAHIV